MATKTYHYEAVDYFSLEELNELGAKGYRVCTVYFIPVYKDLPSGPVVLMEKEIEGPDPIEALCTCGHPKSRHLIGESGVCGVYLCPCGDYREQQQ